MFKRTFLASATVVAALVALAACGSTPAKSATSGAPSTSAMTCSYSNIGGAARTAELPSTTPIMNLTQATLTTDRGTIGITLEPTSSPCTVNSFVSLIKQKYFDNTPCHRLTTSGIFVLQCGDPSGTGMGGPGYQFANELATSAAPQGCNTASCVYPAGTVAMAHSSLPDSNGSQFFLVYKDSPLPYDYTIFGRMSASGLKVVQQIASHGAKAPDANQNTAPVEPVTIERATAQ